jgi:proteic killer suppression protein
MIRSFGCDDTKLLFETGKSKRFSGILSVAERKLQLISSAATLEFLRSPPGNRLEELSGDRAGQHSIRISNKWRVCFVWTEQGADGVEIVDYH